ncbi:hypothetical protein TNCT_403301 [Trichonephila clavata]|uniref:Uncharacterized protein n=1 Tax=Trichonephila clavata TaxID=2740835 RepID=A0A8X6JWJ7_TRICU|nr:hypothetical protein TNCT_403301 [Trichonephila clavata]
MELVSNSAVSLLNNTMPPTCPWTAGYLPEQKCIHPQQNSGLNCPRIFKDFDEAQHYDKAVLETSLGIRIALGNDTESIVLLSLPPWISFSSSPAHAMSLD